MGGQEHCYPILLKLHDWQSFGSVQVEHTSGHFKHEVLLDR